MTRMHNKFFLGIDTSNYTTSVALVDEEENIVKSDRRLLDVKEGEKGLRQSDALFQHWQRLPEMLGPILKEYGGDIAAVCAGSRPRPIEVSYMPVFTAGTAAGRIAADTASAEYFEISHQEGHLLAAAYGNAIDLDGKIILAHLSGGTLEFVKVCEGRHEIVYATKDISYGQLIDRIGVFLGYPFPAGRFVDESALKCGAEGLKNPIPKVFMGEEGLNLSGLENALKKAKNDYDDSLLCAFLMERISESFVKIADQVTEEYDADALLVCGGVASSEYLRRYCKDKKYIFGRKDLCSDNAVGEALAACRKYKSHGC